MSYHNKRTSIKAQGLTETVFGLFLILIVMFFFVDVTFLLFAKALNDDLVQRATRAASMAPTKSEADTIIQVFGEQYQKTPGLIIGVTLKDNYIPALPGAPGLVTVTGTMTVNLPVPVPGYGKNIITINNQAQLPITAGNPGQP